MDEIKNTLDIDRSFDVDFTGSPNVGEDEILTSFSTIETLEIETTNSLTSETVRQNKL
jgi:hypothetical protein